MINGSHTGLSGSQCGYEPGQWSTAIIAGIFSYNYRRGTGCAIVLIGHLNKSSGSQSDYRSLGSIDIAAAVRSILFVEKVEKEKEQDVRVVYQQKDSLAKKENPVAFSLGEEGLKWLGDTIYPLKIC